MVSSKVMALMLREARMASLSASVGSSLDGTLAERMTHISHRLTLTALRSALLRGEPCRQQYNVMTVEEVSRKRFPSALSHFYKIITI